MRRGSSGERSERTPALIKWVKGTAAFQIAEDERKKCLEYRASVDLSNMKESIERIWRLVGTFKGGL
jgi:hypothetical protein